MRKLIFLMAFVAGLALLVAGCTQNNEMANANTAGTATTRTAADGSEIMTMIDENGTKTETRTFRDNPRISRVVVTTTRDGKRTVRVYSPQGESKEVNDVGDALEVTADKLADGAGWVVDKTKEGVVEAGDKLEDVGDKTAEGAKKVGEKTAEGAKTVGTKTAEGAKTVGKKTAEGAKKAGSKVKDALTP